MKGLWDRLKNAVLGFVKQYTFLCIAICIAGVLGLVPSLVTSNEALQVALQRKLLTAGLVWLTLKIVDDGYMRAFDTDEVLKDSPIAVAIFFGLLAVAIALA